MMLTTIDNAAIIMAQVALMFAPGGKRYRGRNSRNTGRAELFSGKQGLQLLFVSC
jgi:hypothetical protein